MRRMMSRLLLVSFGFCWWPLRRTGTLWRALTFCEFSSNERVLEVFFFFFYWYQDVFNLVGRDEKAQPAAGCVILPEPSRLYPWVFVPVCTLFTSCKHMNACTQSRGTAFYLHYFPENGSHYSSVSRCSLCGIMGMCQCFKADLLFRNPNVSVFVRIPPVN